MCWHKENSLNTSRNCDIENYRIELSGLSQCPKWSKFAKKMVKIHVLL